MERASADGRAAANDVPAEVGAAGGDPERPSAVLLAHPATPSAGARLSLDPPLNVLVRVGRSARMPL